MALTKDKIAQLTQNPAELLHSDDISLLHDAADLLRVLKNKGDQRFVDIVNNIESKLKNNQTWTLAKQFPSVAEQGVAALKDWSARADFQRERMLILQHYADERENRYSNSARSIIQERFGTMGVRQEFNNTSGLFFNNNLQTMMMKLSFLDEAISAKDFSVDMDFDKNENFKGTTQDAKVVIDVGVNNGSFTTETLGKTLKAALPPNSSVKFEIGTNKNNEPVLKEMSGATKPEDYIKAHEVITIPSNSLNGNSEKTRDWNGGATGAANGAVQKNITEMSDYDAAYEMLKAANPKMNKQDLERSAEIKARGFEKDPKWRKQLEWEYLANRNGEMLSNPSIKVSVTPSNESENAVIIPHTNNTFSQEYVLITSKTAGNEEKNKNQNLIEQSFSARLENYKKIDGWHENNTVIKEFGLYVQFKEKKYIENLRESGMSEENIQKIVSDFREKYKQVKEYKQVLVAPNEPAYWTIVNFKPNQNQNLKKASEEKNLVPEHEGKVPSQVENVSSVAKPKLTPAIQMKNSKEEQDEERKKREERAIIDAVEPNRIADQPRAIGEKNTTASIEEQKMMEWRKQGMISLEEKQRLAQENNQEERKKLSF